MSAWLYAAPTKKGDGHGGKRRIDELADHGNEEPAMPDCGSLHLVGYLYEIGPTSGDAPLDWQDIDAWCRRTGVNLTPWESRMIRRLSIAHMTAAHEAKKFGAPCPWEDAPYAQLDDYVQAMNAKAEVRRKQESA